MKYSKRLRSMQSSPIRKLTPYAQEAKSKGIKVYHLNIGQPDIETPKSFFEAIQNFDENVLEYTSSSGLPELIKSIQNYYNSYNIKFSENQILITHGGSEALLFTLMAMCDPGDNIIAPEPFYTNYNGFAQCINVSVNPIVTRAEDGFHLPSKENIVSKINKNTKAILLSNPGNPTGTVYTKEEIEMIATIAKEHDLWIIADEVYREFVYDGLSYTSFGNIGYIEDRVAIIDSVSKRYSACGARIGSIASKNNELIEQILKLCQGRLCVAILEQIGCVSLYDTPQTYFDDVNKEYKKRRDLLYNELMKVDGVICEKPTGAFYILAKLPIENSEDFAIWMLKEFNENNETVMICPAKDFYETDGLGCDEIRLAYVLNEKDLLKSATLLKNGLLKYISLQNNKESLSEA